MKRKLPPWCTAVKVELARRNWSVKDLAQATHLSQTHVSGVINGRILSEPAAKAIGEILEIETPYSLAVS